jgi:hypothetical protein
VRGSDDDGRSTEWRLREGEELTAALQEGVRRAEERREAQRDPYVGAGLLDSERFVGSSSDDGQDSDGLKRNLSLDLIKINM